MAVTFIGEETGVPGENHRSVTCHWQTLSHDAVSSTPYHERDSITMQSVPFTTDCIAIFMGSINLLTKSN